MKWLTLKVVKYKRGLLMKKFIVLLLMFCFVLVGSQAGEAAGEVRISSLGYLRGVVEDLIIDSRQNPAQLIMANEDKLIFSDTELYLSSDNNRVSGTPHLIYRINEQTVVSGDLDLNIYRAENYSETIFAPKGSIAYQIDEFLTIGGAFGFNILSDGDNSDQEIVLQTGFNYDVSEHLVVDGSFGLNTYGNVNSDDNRLQLYVRGKNIMTESYDLIIDADLRFNDDNNEQRFNVGQNFDIYDSLVAHGIRLYNEEDLTSITWRWGIEKEVIEDLTLRTGGSSNVFEIDKRGNRDYVGLRTPHINPGIGASYNISDQMAVDFNLGYGDNYIEIGSDHDDSTTGLNLNFSVTTKL